MTALKKQAVAFLNMKQDAVPITSSETLDYVSPDKLFYIGADVIVSGRKSIDIYDDYKNVDINMPTIEERRAMVGVGKRQDHSCASFEEIVEIMYLKEY